MSGLIDSHCHLTFDGLREQVGAVLERASAAGVRTCITVATDLADADRALALAAAHPTVHVAAGIHPHEASKVPSAWDAALSDIVGRPDVCGVGEIGLDYHYDFSDRADQHRVFRRQLELAAAIDKPVVIHSREAQGDTLAILADFPSLSRVVFHCFTGTVGEAVELIDRGFWISLTGVATFKKSDALREVARLVPSDRLMVETDSPYLSPVPVRSVRPNEPAHLVHTAEVLAAQRGVTMAEFAAMTSANARRFFGLPDAGEAQATTRE